MSVCLVIQLGLVGLPSVDYKATFQRSISLLTSVSDAIAFSISLFEVRSQSAIKTSCRSMRLFIDIMLFSSILLWSLYALGVYVNKTTHIGSSV